MRMSRRAYEKMRDNPVEYFADRLRYATLKYTEMVASVYNEKYTVDRGMVLLIKYRNRYRRARRTFDRVQCSWLRKKYGIASKKS